jgi:type II secretory pathway component PulM
MRELQRWWREREPRERVLLAACGLSVLLAAYFLAVLEPLQARSARLAKSLDAELELRLWLEQQRPRVGAGAPVTARERLPDGASLLAAINTSAAASGIAGQLTRVTPTTARGASLDFEAVPYAEFMRWLLAIDARHGARVERISLQQAEAPGTVDVDLVVEF